MGTNSMTFDAGLIAKGADIFERLRIQGAGRYAAKLRAAVTDEEVLRWVASVRASLSPMPGMSRGGDLVAADAGLEVANAIAARDASLLPKYFRLEIRGEWAGSVGGWRPAIAGTLNQTGRSDEEASTFESRADAEAALDSCVLEGANDGDLRIVEVPR